MISHISTFWQSNLWNVLVGCNTLSSIILKQKYYLKWSKNKKAQFSCGEIYGCHFSVRMCEIISHISTLRQSNLWNVLVGCNTPSSIILKQKYYLKWSKNKKSQFSCGEIYGWLPFLCKNVRDDPIYLNVLAINPVECFGRLQYTLN